MPELLTLAAAEKKKDFQEGAIKQDEYN